MAKQTINIGSSANDGTGDPLRTAFDKINDNFDELYGTSLTERVSLDTSPQLGGDLDVVTHSIVSTSNRDIVLAPNGTGAVKASSLKFSGTSISSDDSTLVQINEGLNVSGATTLSTSLALATGATVTGVDNGALGSSATLLATQGAIKTYVDSQVTAQDLDLAGDSGTGAVDLDSQSLTIAGGTGLTSVAGSQTVTLNIDATVATLSGSQTLTNKVITSPTINGATMTGPVTVDTITLDNNIIKSNASNADLELNGNGTGQVRILPNATVVGTLNTADIATTGTHTITGQAEVDSVRIKDNKITTNSSNANLEVSANGSGIIDVQNAMTTVGQTVTGNVAVTGRADIDNIRIDGNVISSTSSNGSITISPNGSGSIVLNAGTISAQDGILGISTAFVNNTIFMARGSKIQANSTNDDVVLESNGTGSVVLDQVSITDNKITTHVSNADLQIDTDGTGVIDILTDTQATVGSAGGASALPGQPTGYIKIKIAGTLRVIPFYDQA